MVAELVSELVEDNGRNGIDGEVSSKGIERHVVLLDDDGFRYVAAHPLAPKGMQKNDLRLIN